MKPTSLRVRFRRICFKKTICRNKTNRRCSNRRSRRTSNGRRRYLLLACCCSNTLCS